MEHDYWPITQIIYFYSGLVFLNNVSVPVSQFVLYWHSSDRFLEMAGFIGYHPRLCVSWLWEFGFIHGLSWQGTLSLEEVNSGSDSDHSSFLVSYASITPYEYFTPYACHTTLDLSRSNESYQTSLASFICAFIFLFIATGVKFSYERCFPILCKSRLADILIITLL